MATLQITLSRAHKIAERLKQKIGEMHAEAVSQARTVTVTGVTGDSQVQRLVEQGERAMALTARADRFIVALAALRAQIGAQNEARGISAMLAELEGVNRRLAHRKVLLAHVRDDGIAPQDLMSYKPISPDSRAMMGGVSVSVLDAAKGVALNTEVSALQREAFAMSDRIAEANAMRFAVELDDDIAAEVTGG